MSKAHRIIISDTSCFIVLTKVGELDILKKLYGQISTTIEIATEFGLPLPEWVIIESVRDNHLQEILALQIDKGESSAIALAIENPGSTVILDDIKARKVAAHLGITYTGTIGVLIKAKLNGIIPLLKPILFKIRNTNFYLSEEIEKHALALACE